MFEKIGVYMLAFFGVVLFMLFPVLLYVVWLDGADEPRTASEVLGATWKMWRETYWGPLL